MPNIPFLRFSTRSEETIKNCPYKLRSKRQQEHQSSVHINKNDDDDRSKNGNMNGKQVIFNIKHYEPLSFGD